MLIYIMYVFNVYLILTLYFFILLVNYQVLYCDRYSLELHFILSPLACINK